MQFKNAVRNVLLKKGTAILMGLGALCQMAQAQSACPSHPSAKAYREMTATREARQAWDISTQRGTIRWIPVTILIARNSAGTNGIPASDVPAIFTRLNKDFAGADVQFYQCGPTIEINRDEYNALDYFADDIICPRYEVPNTLNLWICGSASNPGWAYFPGDAERVVVRAGNHLDAVLPHEVGHFFGLYHSHGNDKSSYELVNELVNGSNCEYAGDEVCDTPAEPPAGLASYVNASCVYTGTSVDANGQAYVPDIANYMGYGNRSCQNRFSPGQLNRISYGANVDRADLVCSTGIAPCGTPVTVYPHALTFEAGLGAWYQGTTDNFNFTVQSGATPTAGTGPASAQQGTQYAFIEATGNTPNLRAELYSPCLDLTSAKSPELSFFYHMEGANTGLLKVEVSKDGGQRWTSVWSRFGNQGTAWVNGIADLSAFASETFLRVRFVAYTTTADVGDIAIDNIEIRNKLCAGTTASIAHTDLACGHVATGTATTTVTGTGGPWTYLWSNGATTSGISGLAPGPYAVTVTAAAGCKTVMGTYVEENNFRITQGAVIEPLNATSNDGSVTINFVEGVAPYTITWTPVGGSATTVSGISTSSYTITGLSGVTLRIEVSDNVGCLYGDNIAPVTFDGFSLTSINSLPYAQNFESGLGNMNNPATNGAYNWASWTGASPAPSTGPSAAAEGTQYALLNSLNSTAAGSNGVLYLPYPNLPFDARPMISFKYHAYGADCQTFGLYAVDRTSGNFNAIWEVVGDQGDVWHTVQLDLSAYFKIRILYGYDFEYAFVGTSAGTGLAFDYAIDDVQLFENPNKLNAVISDVCGAGNNGQVTVNPTGPGAPFSILWSTGATTPTVSGLAGASTVYVTATGADGSQLFDSFNMTTRNPMPLITVRGQSIPEVNDGAVLLNPVGGLAPYTYAWSNSATTQNLVNVAPATYTVTLTDARGCTATAKGTVAAGGCFEAVRDFPYTESFETGLGVWTQVSGDNFDWTRQSGNTPTANTGPSSAQSGTFYVFANAAAPNNPAKTAYLQSGCFDFTGKSASMTFRYHMYGSGMGTLKLQITTNNGSTWTDLWTMTGNQGNAWLTANVSLASYANRFVKFRLFATTGTSKTSDIAVDNIQITTSFLKTLPGDESGSSGISHVMLYPNPASEEVNVSLDATADKQVTCRITDLSGRVVSSSIRSLQWGANNLRLEVGDLSNGVYLLEIVSENDRIVKRFAVQR
jgi:hypothetical protein